MNTAAMRKTGLGRKVGLFGGTFDPPHFGHRHVSLWAIKALDLDQLWWLVAVGNPLKTHSPPPIAKRVEAVQEFVRHPKIIVSDIEERIGSYNSVNTLRYLTRRNPDTRFVWIMGSDNLTGFHKWQDWQAIFLKVPICVFARPGHRASALCSVAARTFKANRLRASDAGLLAELKPPAWALLTVPLRTDSSSAIRRAGRA